MLKSDCGAIVVGFIVSPDNEGRWPHRVGSKVFAFVWKLLFIVSGFAFAGAAYSSSQGSDLTDAEWEAWPDYCKRAFVGSDWGNRSRFAKILPASARGAGPASTGIEGPHHFCVGMVYIDRARSAARKAKRVELLRYAVDEINYSYSRTSTKAPFYPFVSTQLGTAYYRLGQRRNAFEIWISCTEARPRSRECYLAMAQAYLMEDNPKDALDVLLRYDKLKSAPSADAEYFLGHTYFELGRYEEARRHAERASELGYPSSTLKDRLQKVEKK
jgi:tetratricopeptide (TPR) repeat protein